MLGPSGRGFSGRSWAASPLLIVALCSVGCSISFTKQARESIQSVTIDKNVTMPDRLTYTGRTKGVLPLMGGIVGAVASGVEYVSAEDALVGAMRQGQIDVGQIVREQFTKELSSAGIFSSVVPEGGDAQVKLDVRLLGFGATWAFSTELRPALGVTASLVRKDGSVVWQHYEYITSLNGETAKHYLEEYVANPKLIDEGFTSVAKLVAAALVTHMRAG